MKRDVFRSAIVIIAALWATTLQAKTPEEVVHEYVAAIQTEGLVATARYIHPDDLERFKQMFMPLVRSNKLLDKKTFREFLFDAGTTVEKIDAMTGAEFMTAFMARIGGMIPEFKLGPMKVVGSVPEGEVVHILARGSAEVM